MNQTKTRGPGDPWARSQYHGDDFAYRRPWDDDDTDLLADIVQRGSIRGVHAGSEHILTVTERERIAAQRKVDATRHAASLRYDENGRKVAA
jgi:hypothetical protein